MKRNVGDIDKLIRIIIGILALAIAFITQIWLISIISVIMIATALLGWCGIYKVIGISTYKIKRGKN